MATPAAVRAARARDRRLGAASDRAASAEEALRAFTEPVALAPLATGDPVHSPELGIRGTIGAIEGDEAEVLAGGVRVRVPLARLRPDSARAPAETPEPAVRVVTGAPQDVPSEIDVRGRPAQEAREAVRSFVDDAALAGLAQVRVIHGRGTGAVRKAVREELTRHQLVESQESDSANGATVVHLAG
jgi:DNA mismatch repair protein MutS2